MAFWGTLPVYTVKLTNTNPNIIPLGMVVGNDMERVSVARAVADDFMTTFGGSSGLMRKKMNDLVARTILELQKDTLQQYPRATAIYNAEFHFNSMEGGNPNLTKTAANTVSRITRGHPDLAFLSDAAQAAAEGDKIATRDGETRMFELAIIGTAVIEKDKVPGYSGRRQRRRTRRHRN